MRFKRSLAAFAGIGLAFSLAACGEAGTEGGGADVEAADDCEGKFDDGTQMAQWADSGEISVGVKYDQPGLGFKGAADDIPKGFDVEVAKILVADLCIDPQGDGVEWVETVSDNREPFLQQERVGLVLASYSITDDRRSVVGQTGPYMITGQQLLVPADSDIESIDELQGQEVCSVTGSTSIDRINEKGAKGVGFDSYSECVQKVMDGTVDGMSTDGSILAGFAAENEGELSVVGDEFSEERIGVGYQPGNTETCEWINETLTTAYDEGTWAEAFEGTLGPSGVETPEPPELDDCQTF
ncbi:transporter substrate-binding domain-containing protein [Nocardioides panacisoli]|uniref:transporter substrate-binding domain-containing protein n=1 Tax=Nocardioides panacisoli TaxID=627624 RepID=UPI001C62528C|nr:transporter substrate-binding domain-containing protein [Nocardioides panacisoli]QYJ02765.1 transporter substrate-binding domain-containing protein [Nocardioides panacisoli]